MKNNCIVLIGLLLLMLSKSHAQNFALSVLNTPDSIKKNASVIVLNEENVFTVEDIDKASLKVHKAYTVTSEEGKRALVFSQYTSKFQKLDDAELRVYDASGKQVSRIKKKDMATEAMGEGLVDDGFVTYYVVSTKNYPVSVEIDYQVNYRGTLFYPSYEVLTPGEGVLHSAFIAKVPSSLGLRYKNKHINITPVVVDDGKYKTYKWEIKNLIPIQYEESAVSYSNRYPSVILAPNKFKMDDYEGDMTSWKNFGLWYATLKKNIDVFPDSKKQFFKNLVSNAHSDQEKEEIIYNYLQKNFRYVSIQLGIGGYKPFPASFTDDKKYGDCKGLSNFMQAALDAVGIKSYQALINREPNGLPVEPDFPRNQFNHVILLIPSAKDTTWLECTSNSLDFGDLDISTQNKNALVITDNGGILVATPRSNANSNIFTANTTIQLSDDASGITTSTFETKGEYREMMDAIAKEKKDDQKESIVLGLSFKQPDLFEFKKIEPAEIHTTVLKMEIEKIPEFSAGNKLFLAPRLYKFWTGKLPKAETRRLDFYFNFPFTKTDTTAYILPKGFVVDALPAAKELKTDEMHYSSKYWFDEGQRTVFSAATLSLNNHVVPAARYPDVKKFFDEVLSNEAKRIVVKKE